MKNVRFTKKAAAQAVLVAVAGVAALLFGMSEKMGIGQVYHGVYVNGSFIGCASVETDVKRLCQQVRRELSAESGERLSADIRWEYEEVRRPFQKLMTEDELKGAIRGIIVEAADSETERVYTVAIEEFRANFRTLEDVLTFLNRVKAGADETGQYEARLFAEESHISGILNADLTEMTAQGEPVLSGEPPADRLSAGANAQLSCAIAYDAADPGAYQTGVLDMEFIETVEIFENYVEPGQIADIDVQVEEVTKEKESNKIYVVEPGDCLSVIAMDHDTTVSSIVALNGMSGPDQMIRDGQELIIAVPEPDLRIRMTVGEVYEEEYTADPQIIENDSWYTTKEVIHQEGTTGRRERNDIVVYENGMETSRELLHQNILAESQAAVIERGTVIPPTYIRPISGGRYTSGFGRRWGRMHKGVDWACPVGTTVRASSAGTVIQASYSGGYGNNVVISHPDGRMTRYAHNSKLLVQVGQHVNQGDPIALSGNTGRSTGPHVHFEIYINGAAVNPLDYIGN